MEGSAIEPIMSAMVKYRALKCVNAERLEEKEKLHSEKHAKVGQKGSEFYCSDFLIQLQMQLGHCQGNDT